LFSAWPVISFGIVALVMFATALAGWRIARVRGALLSGALMRDVKI
jgi:hypothetical protein